jgi:hypothetical protein
MLAAAGSTRGFLAHATRSSHERALKFATSQNLNESVYKSDDRPRHSRLTEGRHEKITAQTDVDFFLLQAVKRSSLGSFV